MYILGQPDGGLRARRRNEREAANASPLYIDYESDRLVKENGMVGGRGVGTGSWKRVKDEDKGC